MYSLNLIYSKLTICGVGIFKFLQITYAAVEEQI